MTREPEWLLEAAVLAVHQMLIAEHGGLDGVRDRGLLSSTLARPQNLLSYNDPTPSLFDLAASYAYGFARNHCFADGNKRIALTTALMFLELNGLRLEAPKTETYTLMIGLAAGDVTEAGFSAWLAGHCRPIPSGEAP